MRKGCNGCRRKSRVSFGAKNSLTEKTTPTINNKEEKGSTVPHSVIDSRPRNSLLKYNTPEMNYQKIYIKTKYGSTTVAKFMSELESWLGSNYEHLQQSKNGTDCIGLVLGVYKALGLIPADISPGEYPKQWYLEKDIQTHPAFDNLKQSVKVIKIEKQENFLPGDIVVFQFGRAVEAHVALYTTRKSFIHAVAGQVKKGIVLESRGDDKTFSTRVSYAYRLQGDE